MKSFALIIFLLLYAHAICAHDDCEPHVDCKYSVQNRSHCCLEIEVNHDSINSSGRNLSCYGRQCSVDRDCGGLCCVKNKCTKCPKCASDDDCPREEVCCGKNRFTNDGQCRSDCAGSLCESNKDCSGGQCCMKKSRHRICATVTPCMKTPNDDYILLALISTSLGFCVLFLLVFLAFALHKLKRAVKRRRAIRPGRLCMNGTVLTMPTTYPHTNNSRGIQTNSSTQKEQSSHAD